MSTQYDPNRFEPATGRPVNDDQRSFGQLLGDMVTEMSNLFRNELRLARAEMGEKAGEAAGAIPGIAAGAGLGLGALLLSLMAAAAGLSRLFDLEPGWSLLIVAGLAGLAGFLLIRGGMSKLKATNLTPTRTAEQLSRDAQAAKETVR
ncbi:phage holin family protein [Falsiroseomonas oryziterrae]|uniref:phage holin family protein n=1 Tax=Falsiroseomonas oryziterrae TaxID=2911368 RepID=UPI001F355308|nr:phage holin family protein [Roseomonas sp. NPKOSM-4]